MVGQPFRILLIEDNPGDVLLIREMIRDSGGEAVRLERAGRLQEGIELLRQGGIDVVLLDLALPDSEGLSTLSSVRAKSPSVPVVILTGIDDQETALEAVRQGAQDFLIKGRFDGSLLVRSARYAIERNRVEKILVESEERFRSLVEHSPVGISIIQDGRIVYRNPEQNRLFGPMPENFVLRQFRDVHPEDAEKFEALCRTFAENGDGVFETDLRFYPFGKSAEGVELRWVHLSTSPLWFGERKAILVNMVDITRIKEMEHQTIVREKLASLGHLAASMAHEIRNPLSGINISLSALQGILEESEGMQPPVRESAGRIVRNVQAASARIESVIRKVMDFSRPASIRPEAEDLSAAIENAVDFTTTYLRKEGITLDRSRLRALPKCPADSSLITQVIVNLITNAAQAMADREGRKVIGISTDSGEGRIVILISDSGPGIPPAMREKIFDPFYTTRKDGYGIGLSFCRRVILDHGGVLEVGSSPLGGAEFRIELPVPPSPASP